MKRIMLASISLSVLLVLSFSSIIYASEVKIVATDGVGNDEFGTSVAISGNYAIVGAPIDDSNKGSAYIFERGTDWSDTTEIKLTATDGVAGDEFGTSVAISGNYAIVGAPIDDSNKGSAYIFERGTDWSDTTEIKLTASDGTGGDYFGNSVFINGDYAIVGANGDDGSRGAAYIFKRNGTWSQQVKLIATDGAGEDQFGSCVSISGNYAIAGAYGDDDKGSVSGSVYIFERGADWSDTTEVKLTASDGTFFDQFGWSVSISGDYAIVGALQLLSDGSKGAAYIFKRNGTWSQQQKIIASDRQNNDNFGISVSISGDYVLVGANGESSSQGAVYSFLRNGTSWSEKAKEMADYGATGDRFGSSVSINGSYAIVGAPKDDSNKGGAYTYHSIDDLSLPVELSSFTAIPGDDEVTLEWVTESETNNLGFNIYRSLSENGSYTKVNDKLIKGAGNSTFKNFYSFKDIGLSNGLTYWYKLEDVSFDGRTTVHGPVVVTPAAKPVPEQYTLYQNYPNPFNAETVIRYALPKNGHVRLVIFDITGRKVDVLVDGDVSSGYHSTPWNSGNLASNIYVYQLEVDGKVVEARKMILIK